MAEQYRFEVIGRIHSCFGDKFGVPRQPGLVRSAEGVLELLPPYNRAEAVAGLEGFSHIWVLFIFHGVPQGKWHQTVRPPRLGGRKKVGVFASRSTHRPNPIGMSVLELKDIETEGGGVRLRVAGLDLMDGTPVIDIKPYIPYSDSIADARSGFATGAPEAKFTIEFTPEAARQIAEQEAAGHAGLRQLIEELLQYDYRPGYLSDDESRDRHGMRLHGFELRWRVRGDVVTVIELSPVD